MPFPGQRIWPGTLIPVSHKRKPRPRRRAAAQQLTLVSVEPARDAMGVVYTAPIPVTIEQAVRARRPMFHPLADAAREGRASANRRPLGDEPPAGYTADELHAWLVARLRHLARRWGHRRSDAATFAGYDNRTARARAAH